MNVLFIAACGSIALIRQARALLDTHGLMRRTSLMLVAGWLALSLFTGAQCAWYMRPFFGISYMGRGATVFFSGTRPDFRGARSFYEAVYNLVSPPDGSRK